MSPKFAENLKTFPFLFRNKNVTTNMIRACLNKYGMNELFFLAGMNDFNEKATPSRAEFLFTIFCTLDNPINVDKGTIDKVELQIKQGIKEYNFANMNSKNKFIKVIPITLQACLDPLVSPSITNLASSLSECTISLESYNGYTNKTFFTKSTFHNTLKDVLIKKDHVDSFLKDYKDIFGIMLKLEMKTMFSVAKEVENMK